MAQKQTKKMNLENLPDPKKHQTVSFVKSGLRVTACIFALLGSYGIGFFGLLLAEIVGIYEEMV